MQQPDTDRGRDCPQRPLVPQLPRTYVVRAPAGQTGTHHQRGRDRHRRYGEEHDPPVGVLDDQAGDRGTDEGRYDPAGRERGEDPRAEAGRVQLTHDDVQRDREQTGAEALDDAARDEDLHRRRQARRSSRPARNHAVPCQSGRVGPLRSLQVPETTIATTPEASGPPNASAYSGRPSSACATVGIAVATARDSNATRVISATIPTVRARYCGARTPALVCSGPAAATCGHAERPSPLKCTLSQPHFRETAARIRARIGGPAWVAAARSHPAVGGEEHDAGAGHAGAGEQGDRVALVATADQPAERTDRQEQVVEALVERPRPSSLDLGVLRPGTADRCSASGTAGFPWRTRPHGTHQRRQRRSARSCSCGERTATPANPSRRRALGWSGTPRRRCPHRSTA